MNCTERPDPVGNATAWQGCSMPMVHGGACTATCNVGFTATVAPRATCNLGNFTVVRTCTANSKWQPAWRAFDRA